MDNKEYKRLLELKELINTNQANQNDKKKYMQLMYKNGHIRKKQYDDYIANRNAEDIIKGALTIGGVLLAGWLISKLFD